MMRRGDDQHEGGCRHGLPMLEEPPGHADLADRLEEGQHGRGPEDHLAEGRREDDQRDPSHHVPADGQQDAEHQDEEDEMPEAHRGRVRP